jgi:hypothetical protein
MANGAERRMKLTTPLGATLSLYSSVQNGERGAMLMIDMEQPGDGRHAEVWLNQANLDDLAFVLKYTSGWWQS